MVYCPPPLNVDIFLNKLECNLCHGINIELGEAEHIDRGKGAGRICSNCNNQNVTLSCSQCLRVCHSENCKSKRGLVTGHKKFYCSVEEQFTCWT